MTNKDEIDALKARIEELERANKKPEPFKPQPYEPIDWTARMSMRPRRWRQWSTRCLIISCVTSFATTVRRRPPLRFQTRRA
jgi:hypothetical protein